MRQSLATLTPPATSFSGSAAVPAAPPPPWPARVAALMAEIDALIDERIAAPHDATAGSADLIATARDLAHLEQARAELARLAATDAERRAEQRAALALLAREAPALYTALASVAIQLTSTLSAATPFARPPGWGLDRAPRLRSRRRDH